ncbi:hypothetical protein [Amycolatopsis benzoatilytica]|uniref:hypothetical protein n=1 Tax=Amycolatopsis benzoatilytica TaxID=346045 RepID=UPI00037006D5|nr:hypothetical protein [Amycolatopsis benzoatilytica]
MNDEVSVAELLVREGYERRMPPASRSRWRLVAVMLAVVVGCGAAAMLVSYGTTAYDGSARVTEMRVIQMPDRTEGGGGVDESNPPTTPVEGTEDITTVPPPSKVRLNPFDDSSTPDRPSGSAPAHSTSAQPPASTHPTSGTPDTPSSSSGPTDSTAPSTTGTSRPPCVLQIICL